MGERYYRHLDRIQYYLMVTDETVFVVVGFQLRVEQEQEGVTKVQL
jgi:hypothetical protein